MKITTMLALYFSQYRHYLIHNHRISKIKPKSGPSTPYSTKSVPDNATPKHTIKFPSPGSHKTDKRLMAVINEETPPVVVIHGWAGCSDLYLKKYSKIYEDRGLVTLNYSNNKNFLFWRRPQLKLFGENFVRVLQEAKLESRPIIVHCFSNGGPFAYRSCATALEKSFKSVQVKGVIFDSGPGEQSSLNIYHSMTYIVGGNIFYNFPASIIGTLLWFYDVFRNILIGDYDAQDPIQWLKVQGNICPQFFVYSKADEIIPWKDIESFIKIRKNLGVDVSTLRFIDSLHVQHYKYNQKEYVNGICDFLAKCLKTKE